LEDVADLMDTVHQNRELISYFIKHGEDSKENWGIRYRELARDLNRRAGKVNAAAGLRLMRDFVVNPQNYFTIESTPGLQGNGVEVIELVGASGLWTSRFVEGFPVGPNVCTTEGESDLSLVRFSSCRTHIDYHTKHERGWVVYATGHRETRKFKDGRFDSIFSYRNESSHGLREFIPRDGQSDWSATVTLDGSASLSRSQHEKSPIEMALYLPTGDFIVRRYFANGQLNVERVSDGFPPKLTRCFGENGVELAPNGNGPYRELRSWTELGPHWCVGHLVNGQLHGELRLLNPVGKTHWVEHYNMVRPTK